MRGLPHGLLELLGLDVLRRVREWTITQKYGRFHLDIVFTAKSFKSPAKSARQHEQGHLEKQKSQDGTTPPGNPSGSASVKQSAKDIAGPNKLAENRLPIQPNSGRPVGFKSTKRKRKSPSTRRRNRLRWERWQAKRRAQLPKSSRQPDSVTCPLESSNPNPADSVNRQQCVEQNTLCTTNFESVSSAPDSEPSLEHEESPVEDTSENTDSVEPGQSVHARTSQLNDPESTHSDLDTSDCSESADSFYEWLMRQPKCSNCATPQSVPNGLNKCTRCSIALYCDRGCQAEHWKEHRLQCKPAC